jgi:hypothetical protein
MGFKQKLKKQKEELFLFIKFVLGAVIIGFWRERFGLRTECGGKAKQATNKEAE